MTLPTRLFQATIAALALAACAIAAVQAPAALEHGLHLRIRATTAFTPLITAPCSAAVALLVAWRAPARPDARAAAWLLTAGALMVALVVVPTGQASLLHELAYSASYAAWTLLFLRFTMVFPRPLEPADLERPRGAAPRSSWATLGRPLARVRAFLVRRPSALWWIAAVWLVLTWVQTTRYANPYYLIAADSSTEPFLLFLAVPVFLALITLAISFLWTGYRLAGPADRQKVLWIVLGWVSTFFWILFGISLLYLPGYTDVELLRLVSRFYWPTFYPVAWLVPLAGLAVAVLYAGAFDVRPVISRTTAYGALVLALTFLFAAVEEIVASQVVARLGLPDGVATLVGAAAIAVALGPLHMRLQRAVRRVEASAPAETPRGDVALP